MKKEIVDETEEGLPKIDLPIIELKIQSTGELVKFRPFRVKEEKLLLIAAESKDEKEIVTTAIQIVNNCMLDSKINVESLPYFDIDYLLIALRAKSVSESISVKFTCNNTKENEKCGNVFDSTIDISNCEVIKNESIPEKYDLGNGIIITMKYPTYRLMKTLSDSDGALETKIKIMASCIDRIQNKDKIYTTKDYSHSEFKEFIENLSEGQFKKLEGFIDNLPYFAVKSRHKCNKCEFEHNIEYTDFESFFY